MLSFIPLDRFSRNLEAQECYATVAHRQHRELSFPQSVITTWQTRKVVRRMYEYFVWRSVRWRRYAAHVGTWLKTFRDNRSRNSSYQSWAREIWYGDRTKQPYTIQQNSPTQYNKTALHNTTKQPYTILQNSPTQYYKTALHNTTKQPYTIQQNSPTQHNKTALHNTTKQPYTT
jgi:hypothetical protein